MTTNNITFTKETVDELRDKYNTATTMGERQFMFRGNLLLVDYAKYLLEFLEIELQTKHK